MQVKESAAASTEHRHPHVNLPVEMPAMPNLSEYLIHEHRHCDAAFAIAESAVAQGDWLAVRPPLARYSSEVLTHFAREEAVLFPAFESASGITQGPTAVMRDEHDQVRELLEALEAATEREDGDAWLGYADTLMILLQQHNMKEEQVLYPMAERLLAAELEPLCERLRALKLS